MLSFFPVCYQYKFSVPSKSILQIHTQSNFESMGIFMIILDPDMANINKNNK